MARPRPVPAAAAVTAAAALLALPVLAATPASAAPAAPASLTVVHGVRGLVADVRMDGRLVLSGFAPERVTDALSLTPGQHHVQAWPSGVAADTPPVVDQVFSVTPGEQATAAIGLSAAGTPVVTVYDDRELLPTPGATALAVRGLAKAAPVQVVAGDRTVATALAPTQQDVAQVAPGTYPVQVRTADQPTPLVPPQDVPVSAGRATVLYLVGSQSDATLGWVAQTVLPAAQTSAPLRVDTGVGPLPDEGGSLPRPAVMAVVLLLAAGGAAAGRRLTRA